MHGIFRYVLAHLVVLGHLWRGLWEIAGAHPGVYAVFSFYLLSGYLMALTLSRTYARTFRGTGRFFGNRALRIFPPYLFVLAATVALFHLAEPHTLRVNLIMNLPRTMEGWLKNVFIFGLGPGLFGGPAERPRLVPPAWSLDVELCFYVVMGLALGRNRRVALAWLLGSIAYTVYAVSTGIPWAARYTPVAAASLPFSLGAVLYHQGQWLLDRFGARVEWLARATGISGNALRGGLALALLALFTVHAVEANSLWDRPLVEGFYFSLLLSAVLLVCLNALPTRALPPRLVAFDRLLGNLSYPVFLCHWLVAAVVAKLAFGSRFPDGGALFWSALFFVNLLALAIHLGVEHPVERLRDAVRPTT